MRHIAAYALLVLGGKESPSAAEVEKVVKDAGATPDKAQIEALVEAMKGKEFHELAAAGIAKLGSMGGSAAPAGGAASASAAPAKKEEVVEVEEEVDMGGMFGDDDY